MQSHQIKEHIIGFRVLSSGAFVKIHRNLQVEILDGSSPKWIELKGIQPVEIKIVELSSQYIVLACCDFQASILFLLDLKNKKCVAQENYGEIRSIYILSDHSFLINSTDVGTVNDCITINKDSRFEEFSKKFNDRYEMNANFPIRYIPLPNHSGYIYYDGHHQSTIKIITTDFQIKTELRLCKVNYDPFFRHGILGKGPSYESTIVDSTLFSDDSFACITEYRNKYTLPHHMDERRTHYLHLIKNDLSQAYKINLYGLVPLGLLKLDDDHVAVIGFHEKDDKANTKFAIKIYNSKGKKVKKLRLEDSYDDFIAMSNGQLVTCSKAGKIVTHHVLPSKEKLRNETQVVLGKFLPKVLLPMVTDYASFFSSQHGSKFEEKDYLDLDSGFFPKWGSNR